MDMSLWVLEMAQFRACCRLRSHASEGKPQGRDTAFPQPILPCWSVKRCGPRADSSSDVTHTGSAAEVFTSILFLWVFVSWSIDFHYRKIRKSKKKWCMSSAAVIWHLFIAAFSSYIARPDCSVPFSLVMHLNSLLFDKYRSTSSSLMASW